MKLKNMKLKNMVSKMNIVLFQYSSDTPTEKILRHYHIAWWIIYLCCFSNVTMASQLALILIFGMDPISTAIFIVSTAIALILTIPCVFCWLWVNDIEKVLGVRGIPMPGGKTLDDRARNWALWMMLWFAIAILGPWLVKSIIT